MLVANYRECAVSSSSSSTQNQTRTVRTATRQQLTNRANQAGVCFVLNEYSEDPDTSAFVVGHHVPQPTETTEQIPLTPTASAAVDMMSTANFNGRVTNDDDEPLASEADHRTGWNETFKSGTYRGMRYGIVLHDYPKQVVTLAKAKSVTTNMREFLSWAQRHCRIDVAASTVRTQDKWAGICWYVSRWVQRVFSHRFRTRIPSGLTCKICGTVRKEERLPPRPDPSTCPHRHTDHREEQRHFVSIVELTLILFRVRSFSGIEATRSASSNRDEELADRVSRHTTITE